VKTDAERSTLTTPSSERASSAGRARNPVVRFLGEVPGLVLMALVLALLIKTFLVQAFFIPSPSMQPTLQVGDRVLVTKIPYYLHEPSRLDVIVFEDPDAEAQPDRGVVGGALHWLFQGLGVQKPDHEDFIKRIVGLPGDRVWAEDGVVYVNKVAVDEPYLLQPTRDFPKTRVPDDAYFVMGDNRSNSLDSRFGLGFIPREKVVGKAFMVVWPVSRMGGV
jgi:signal peptidase I